MGQSFLPATGRVHLVLVPGFAGFDALGQIEYYAGVTPVFRAWKAGSPVGSRVVLHYFDNLPTAGVATRAKRLRGYLAKRVARGELQPGDGLALVGHSTGGLDIRRMLSDLAALGETPIPVDGAQDTAVEVAAVDILAMIRRIVFISVPQWGTNIADWVSSHPLARHEIIKDLQRMVTCARVPQIDEVERWFAGGAATLSSADLFRAVHDALREIDTSVCRGDPTGVADAQQAAAELELYLRHIVTDFAAIDDLRAGAPKARPASPAHFDAEARARELDQWRALGVQTRSYATLGTRPFEFRESSHAPAWELSKPATYPAFNLLPGMSDRTDIVYRTCYRACAGGPFRSPDGAVRTATAFGTDTQRTIEVWDNDGIVNTLSMLWPDGPATRLVEGDHGDIIGHYKHRPAAGGGTDRAFHTYDLLGSDSGFTTRTFERVWEDIFTFCASEAARNETA